LEANITAAHHRELQFYQRCYSTGFTDVGALFEENVGARGLYFFVRHFPCSAIPCYGCPCKTLLYELSWSRIARQQWIVMQKNVQNGKVLLFRIWVVPKFVGPRVLPNSLNTRKSGHVCAVLSCGGVYVYELAASACARIYVSVTAFGTTVRDTEWHRIASSASDTRCCWSCWWLMRAASSLETRLRH